MVGSDNGLDSADATHSGSCENSPARVHRGRSATSNRSEARARTLLPLALEELRRDPFAEGDMYVGDLLMTVLRELKAPQAELKPIVATAIARLDELDDEDRENLEPQLRQAYERL